MTGLWREGTEADGAQGSLGQGGALLTFLPFLLWSSVTVSHLGQKPDSWSQRLHNSLLLCLVPVVRWGVLCQVSWNLPGSSKLRIPLPK